MSDIREFLVVSFVEDVIEKGGLVVDSHLLERIVPVLLVMVWVERLMVSAVGVPPGVVHPNVVA